MGVAEYMKRFEQRKQAEKENHLRAETPEQYQDIAVHETDTPVRNRRNVSMRSDERGGE